MIRTSRRYRPKLLLLLALTLLVAALPAAEASWFTRILRHADDASPKRAGKGAFGGFDDVGLHLKSLPGATRGRTVAVEATGEGHWRLRNADGETFTAATPDEFKRGIQLLAPVNSGDVVAHVFVLSAETIFRHNTQLKILPPDAELKVLFDGQVRGVVRRVVSGTERYYLDAGGGVHVPVTTREPVHEALWQLSRSVDLADIRVLALEPGATTLLKRTPPPSPGPGRMSVEAVDPDRLRHMFPAVARGTVVITGRIDGPVLHYRPSSGPERTLSHSQLRMDAQASDVNLVIVSSSSARQPGTRNWLWQRVDLARQADGKTKPSLGDLVRQMTGGVPVEVQVADQGARQVSLVFSGLAGGGRGWSAPVSDAWRDLAPEVTGTIVANGLQLHLRSREHQKELDDRIIPGIPSDIQFGYIAFLLLGVIGINVAQGWWQRIWPLEAPDDYPRRGGYWAARFVRGTVYILLFLPLVSPISAPMVALQWVWRMMTGAYAIATYPFRRGRAA